MTKVNVYQIVTDRILAKMRQGEIPWKKPWVGGKDAAVSWETQKPYRGVNALLLPPGEYATFNAVKKAGGHVKKGEKAHIVVFWKIIEKKEEDEDTGEIENRKIPLLRYYSVFDINLQCEGLESKRKKDETFDHDPIAEAEKIIEGYQDRPPIKFAPGRACYRPSTDEIFVPEISDYEHADEYYSTIYHELAHSTGHHKRLNRAEVGSSAFGTDPYAKEELIAEVTAAMLCGITGINNERNETNSAAYLQSWMKRLEEDEKLIVCAASKAQKAADFIQGLEVENGDQH